MPFAGITISTRERAGFRDRGDHHRSHQNFRRRQYRSGGSCGKDLEDKGDDQFEISDDRGVEEVYQAVLKKGMQPVMNDYVFV